MPNPFEDMEPDERDIGDWEIEEDLKNERMPNSYTKPDTSG